VKRFALIGAAGFIAPRHMRAVKDTGNQLIAALDPNDSVGVLDSYFPEANFFTEFERFDRHIDKLRRRGKGVEYVVICSPNYLHDSHIRFALRSGAHAICEKPIVLNPWNLDALAAFEAESGCRVYTILQLRLHPTIRALKQRVDETPTDHVFDVDLTYLTARGPWYHQSWKGDMAKAGGVATNIGVHFFDMLAWLFGPVVKSTLHLGAPDVAAGYLELQRARVRWFLSINPSHLPEHVQQAAGRSFRSVIVDDKEIVFTEGFTDLHTESYKDILAGGGFGIADSRPSIETVYRIRQDRPVGITGPHHPFCARVASHSAAAQ
jgi:UDP-N-acetyl-2-amino-2-deoxyglucuronate dehydrogenase